MSDALTDISRDQERGRLYHDFLSNIISYLKNPSEESYQTLEESAKRTDGVQRGYSSGTTSLSTGLKELVEGLEQKDEEAWVRFLSNIGPNSSRYRELKAISPVADKTLLTVNYGKGFATFDLEELEAMLHKKIGDKKWVTYDGDEYTIPLSRDKLEEIFLESEVVWLRCLTSGIEEPRKKAD